MKTNYGIVFSGDVEFKVLAIWVKSYNKKSLWNFANDLYEEKLKGKYEHYDTMGFETLEELNNFIVEQ